MMERIGFIGIVLDDLARAAQVNAVIGDFQSLVCGRIGLPDHDHALGIIGLIVKGDDVSVSKLTARLGNIPDVTVKSAMTKEVQK